LIISIANSNAKSVEVTDYRQKYVASVQEYILFNYPKPIKIADISKILNVERSYLYRIFKNATGESIGQYLISVRIQQAQKLLRETQFSVTSISQIVGYLNYPSFYRVFKSLSGLTPIEYRIKEAKKSRL